jgi:tetratricopeptide (TPR) repeat protein
VTTAGAGPARTLRIKCPTWDHVVDFYTVKIKDRRTLSVRLPFNPRPRSTITIALELPNDMVIAVDAVAERVQPAADGKRAAVRLVLRDASEMIGRLETLVSDGGGVVADAPKPRPVVTPAVARRPPAVSTPIAIPMDAPINEVIEQPPPPTIDQVGKDQRNVFMRLEKVLGSMREAAAHEVLGVPWGASVAQIRNAYCDLTKNYHPDLFARHQSAAILFLAQEVFIQINKAYDRMRDAAAAAGEAIISGSALVPHDGWFAGFDDLGTLGPRSPLNKNKRSKSPQLNVSIPMPDDDMPVPVDDKAKRKGAAHHTASGSVKVNFSSGAAPKRQSSVQAVASPLSAAPPLSATPPPAAEPLAAAPPLAATPPPAASPPAAPGDVFSTDELFANLGWGDADTGAKSASVEKTTDDKTGEPESNQESANQESAEELIARGEAAFEAGDFETARKEMAQALKGAPRNRSVRALYYVASARLLMAEDNSVEAMTQLEAALAHDPSCEQARQAMQEISGGGKRSGLFRRLFTK